MISFDDDEQLVQVIAAAQRLPIEAREEFISAAQRALVLLKPGARAAVLIEKLLKVTLLRVMAQAADGEHYGSSELGFASRSAAAAEHEREMISQRSSAGLQAAKARGVQLGETGATNGQSAVQLDLER